LYYFSRTDLQPAVCLFVAAGFIFFQFLFKAGVQASPAIQAELALQLLLGYLIKNHNNYKNYYVFKNT
jgi:hypothetical protein